MKFMKFVVELTEKEYARFVQDAEQYEESLDIEDFNPQDYSGGNFDDCYEMGVTDGINEATFNLVKLLGDPVVED